ncbi:MAG: universal stress protein [Alphaproteobacteria bacterium]
MGAVKRLIVATDLSARSDRAVERAVALAAEAQAALTVVHVVDAQLPGRIVERQLEDAQAVISDHLASLPDSAKVSTEIAVLLGTDAEDIIRRAEETDADLVIVGVHRNEPSRRLFTGTTAERVIRKGTRPVLMVKDRVQGPYRRVMMGIDFSVCSRRALGFALKLLPLAGFQLVHAYEVPFKGFLTGSDTQRMVARKHEGEMELLVKEELGALLSSVATPPSCETVLREGPVRKVLQEQMERLKPDLLVVGTHGRTGVAGALLGSVAQDLLGDPPCDVLAVKAW